MAQSFAEQGYDFVGIDRRGNGHSGGMRDIIPPVDEVMDDYVKYFDLADQNFSGKNVPKFLLGYSLGGLFSVKLSNMLKD